MLVIALCMAYFCRAKINKNLWAPYFKISPPYFECSGAGTGGLLGLSLISYYVTPWIYFYNNIELSTAATVGTWANCLLEASQR